MRCPHCEAQWHLAPDKKAINANCPFCNGNLYEELKAPYTTESVLREIVSRFGMDILSNSEELISAFLLLAPNLEKELQGLLMLNLCGGIDRFLSLKTASKQEIETSRSQQINQMTHILTEVCDAFLSVIDVHFDKNAITNNVFPQETSNWEYINLGNNTVELTFFKGQLPTHVIFPSHIGSKKVVSIGSTVLGDTKLKGSDRVNVESIVVPAGVTRIENGAFYGCKSLKEVSLPDGLESIGENVFKSCKALSAVLLPDSVRFIGNGAFSGSGIRSIVLSGCIEIIPKEAFKNCKQLANVTILEGITDIKCEAFSGCKAIKSLTIPNSVTFIDALAFYECKGLNSVILPDSINYIGCQAFKYCSGLTNVNIPSNLKDLENDVFYGCGFSSFVIPNGVVRIKEDAFANCWSLARITIPQSVTKIDNDAFFNIDDDIRIICNKDSYAHKWASSHKIAIELIEA